MKEPPKNRPKNKLWSYVTGTKGINRIRVYESYEDGPIYMEWHDRSGRNRESLNILDKSLAVRIADKAASEQARKRHADRAEQLLGLPKRRGLKELLTRLHADRGAEWSASHKRGQERFRKFWLQRLGPDADLRSITPAQVEGAVRKEGQRKKWSPATRTRYLRYLVDAFYYAQHRLKWLTEEHNLSAVAFPKGEQRSLPYTTAELRAVLREAPKVDLRCAALGWLAANTGRRLDAIRQLKASAVQERDDALVVTFPGKTDKARRTGEAAVVGEARRVLGLLLQTPAVQATGALFPSGDLMDKSVRRPLISKEHLTALWHEAERTAEVEEVKGRAYHGIKRWFATSHKDISAASRQSGTSAEMLQGRYRQDLLAPKIELAETLDKELRSA